MKALVTSKSFGKHSPEAIASLKEAGIELDWISRPSPASEDIVAEIGDCEALIVGNDTVDRSVLEAGRKLRVVHMNGTGLDAIDVESASSLGILVANTPGANRNAVAEFTVALILLAGRSVGPHAEALREGRWERSAGRELSGKVLGLVGLGNIGKRVVELVAGFDVVVLAYDPYPDREWAATRGVRLAEGPDEVFMEADFVALTAPLTPETENLADSRRIGFMKWSAYLVNTARGGLVDEAALCAAVREGRIAGAALDTFREEPLPLDSPLRIPGITLTPHLAATSIETAANVSLIVARNLIDILVRGRIDIAVNAAEARASGRLAERFIASKST
jgi:D-3-phosphoglycerate dehydrogenase